MKPRSLMKSFSQVRLQFSHLPKGEVNLENLNSETKSVNSFLLLDLVFRAYEKQANLCKLEMLIMASVKVDFRKTCQCFNNFMVDFDEPWQRKVSVVSMSFIGHLPTKLDQIRTPFPPTRPCEMKSSSSFRKRAPVKEPGEDQGSASSKLERGLFPYNQHYRTGKDPQYGGSRKQQRPLCLSKNHASHAQKKTCFATKNRTHLAIGERHIFQGDYEWVMFLQLLNRHEKHN